MIFNISEQQYSTFLAFRRLIFWELKKLDYLHPATISRIFELGSEHGFCRDTVDGILLECKEDLRP